MSITSNTDILASDFINESERDATPANDAGRVPKFESDGKIGRKHLRVAFGGTGADGALSISSGTTTVDLGSARIYILNYSSISITGTGKLAFSNPHANGTVVIIKCQGNATLTSSATPMIDLEGIGGSGGTGGSRSSAGSGAGNDGNDGQTYGFVKSNKGLTDGTGGAGTNSAGAGGALPTMSFVGGGVTDFTYDSILAKYPRLFVGAGGGGGGAAWGSGGSGTVVGGNGGRGGGCLIMEIGGAINFTTTNGISVAGQDGQNGSHTGTPTNFAAHPGAGGGAGSCFITYHSVTAFSGTVKVSSGVSGIQEVGGTPGNNAGPGGGSSGINAGTTGSTNVSTASASAGAGGAGLSMNKLNTELV